MADTETQGQRTWKALGGAILFILGVGAINAVGFTSFAVIYTLGWILLFAGVVGFVLSFAFRGAGSIFLGMVTAVLSFVLGGLMLLNPTASLGTVTLLLSMYFVVDGIITIVVALSSPAENRGWSIFTGIVMAILGVAIWRHWPAASYYIFGIFIGIGLILSGISLLGSSIGRVQAPHRARYA